MALLNNGFFLLCGLFQLLALGFMWLYVIEIRQGCASDGYEVYQYHWRFLFWASLIIEIVLWLTISELQKRIQLLIFLSLIAWGISLILYFALSIGKTLEGSIKHNTRLAARVAATNMIILGIVAWIIYV